jgi:hypothetical protein
MGLRNRGGPVQTLRDPDRRSFLGRVLGGALLAAAGAVPGAEAVARPRRSPRRMVVDRDPADPARPAAIGRQRTSPPGPRPRPADTDFGYNSDPGGLGALIGSQAPRQRFVVCPGHRRCPRR